MRSSGAGGGAADLCRKVSSVDPGGRGQGTIVWRAGHLWILSLLPHSPEATDSIISNMSSLELARLVLCSAISVHDVGPVLSTSWMGDPHPGDK